MRDEVALPVSDTRPSAVHFRYVTTCSVLTDCVFWWIASLLLVLLTSLFVLLRWLWMYFLSFQVTVERVLRVYPILSQARRLEVCAWEHRKLPRCACGGAPAANDFWTFCVIDFTRVCTMQILSLTGPVWKAVNLNIVYRDSG